MPTIRKWKKVNEERNVLDKFTITDNDARTYLRIWKGKVEVDAFSKHLEISLLPCNPSIFWEVRGAELKTVLESRDGDILELKQQIAYAARSPRKYDVQETIAKLNGKKINSEKLNELRKQIHYRI